MAEVEALRRENRRERERYEDLVCIFNISHISIYVLDATRCPCASAAWLPDEQIIPILAQITKKEDRPALKIAILLIKPFPFSSDTIDFNVHVFQSLYIPILLLYRV